MHFLDIKKSSKLSFCVIDFSLSLLHVHLTDPSNVASRPSDAADCNSNAASGLRNEGALLQSVINAVNAVVLHCQQETTERKSQHNTD